MLFLCCFSKISVSFLYLFKVCHSKDGQALHEALENSGTVRCLEVLRLVAATQPRSVRVRDDWTTTPDEPEYERSTEERRGNRACASCKPASHENWNDQQRHCQPVWPDFLRFLPCNETQPHDVSRQRTGTPKQLRIDAAERSRAGHEIEQEAAARHQQGRERGPLVDQIIRDDAQQEAERDERRRQAEQRQQHAAAKQQHRAQQPDRAGRDGAGRNRAFLAMRGIEADVAGVVQEHAADVEQARAAAEHGEPRPRSAPGQQPAREAIRPDGGKIGDPAEDQQGAQQRRLIGMRCQDWGIVFADRRRDHYFVSDEPKSVGKFWQS